MPLFNLLHLGRHMLRLSEVTRNAVATPLYILKRYALFVQTADRLCVFFLVPSQ